jgi:hypothetical protein
MSSGCLLPLFFAGLFLHDCVLNNYFKDDRLKAGAAFLYGKFIFHSDRQKGSLVEAF